MCGLTRPPLPPSPPKARLKTSFREYIDQNKDQKMGFYEFLGLALFWHSRGQTLGALAFSMEAAKVIAEAFDEVLKGYVNEDVQGDCQLSHSKVRSYFQVWLKPSVCPLCALCMPPACRPLHALCRRANAVGIQALHGTCHTNS